MEAVEVYFAFPVKEKGVGLQRGQRSEFIMVAASGSFAVLF